MTNHAAVVLALFAGLLVFLALPPLIALAREHPERALIYKLTPLALLSFILWAALIAWAWTGKRNDTVVSRYVTKLRDKNRLPLLVTLLVIMGVAAALLPLLR